MVRMIRRVHLSKDLLERGPVRLVIITLTSLIFYDVTLIVELLLSHRIEQSAHAVGFHKEGELEKIRGDHLKVIRAIRISRAVNACTCFLQRFEIIVIVVLRALKHHVLEKMSETRSADYLILRADVIPEVNRNDRRRCIAVHYHAEAVL